MKRMNRVLEVNGKAQYAVVEGGTSQGVFKAFLQDHFPDLGNACLTLPPLQP
jgi:FAD/FMN-containing dehydrogenase